MTIILLIIVLSLAAPLSGVAQAHYQMYGPYEVIARDGKYAYTKKGSEADMWAAFELAQKGDSPQALRLINAYADKLQRIEGHDAPLCLSEGNDAAKVSSNGGLEKYGAACHPPHHTTV